ncbi:MAG: hypothetical protein ABSG37_12625 [Candidatus Limnocylindrales bacterium]
MRLGADDCVRSFLAGAGNRGESISTPTWKTPTTLARLVAVVAAVLVAGVLDGYALGSDAAEGSRYLWAGIAARAVHRRSGWAREDAA